MPTESQCDAVCCTLLHEAAATGNDVSLVVRGASMLPSLWPGDMLTVRHCPTNQFRPGQIILFHRDDKLTAHRILTVCGDAILTRGDSVDSPDAPVHPTQIVGRVEKIQRNGRAISLEQKPWQRAAAWILRHSDLSMRATLYLARRTRKTWDMPTPRATNQPDNSPT